MIWAVSVASRYLKHSLLIVNSCNTLPSLLIRPFTTSKDIPFYRPDPSARRPTKVCDPYGQGGRPLEYSVAKGLLPTLNNGWFLVEEDSKIENSHEGDNLKLQRRVPKSLCKEFFHPDFVCGSRFISVVSAVAHNNNHYPKISLERRLMRREKAWRVITKVSCWTPTLNGLSYNDFHVAMLIDVEAARPDMDGIIVPESDSSKKHI